MGECNSPVKTVVVAVQEAVESMVQESEEAMRV